jgi:hypothetical protein
MSELLTTYTGGCHCGTIRFQVSLMPEEHVASDCNCSICLKKGFLHLIVPPDRFTLLSGEAALATYTFNTETAQHLFCRVCGIHAFYRPRSHPDSFDVNVRCLDGNVLSRFRIEPFDGANWEQNVDSLKSVFPTVAME